MTARGHLEADIAAASGMELPEGIDAVVTSGTVPTEEGSAAVFSFSARS